MIKLTDLGGGARNLSTATITEIRRIPDTLLVLLNGSTLIVKESVDQVLERIDTSYAEHGVAASSAIWKKAA